MANIIGTEASDMLYGTAGGDTISGLGGYDTFNLSYGPDTLDGGEGYDTLYSYTPWLGLPAGARHFTLTGNRFFDGTGLIDTAFSGIEQVQITNSEAGDVTFDGSASQIALLLTLGSGTHTATGGSGYDEFYVLGGSGSFDGGAGIYDRFSLTIDTSLNGKTVFATQSGGAVILSQAGRADTVLRNIETIEVGAANAGLRLDASAITANFQFRATTFADVFIGGSGNDGVLAYDPGSGAGDSFTGGAGADKFSFGSFASFAGATITDLEAEDSIILYTGSTPVKFIGTAAFSGTAGELRTVRGSNQTLLIGDADGDGVGESTLTLAGSFQIAADFTTGALQRIPDLIRGTAATDMVDTASGASVSQVVETLGGDDVITIRRGHFTIDGGEGYDRVFAHSAPLDMPLGARSYTFTDDRLLASSGRLDASLASVELVHLWDVSAYDVTVDASALSDVELELVLMAGTHHVVSGGGNDQISVYRGAGSFDGGSGGDRLWFQLDNSSQPAMLTVSESDGTTLLRQLGKRDLTTRNIEYFSVEAGAGALRVDASAISKSWGFLSTAFADTIIGGAGNDSFHTGTNATGAGDMLTGGSGADSFAFYDVAGLHGTTITDFSVGDRLYLNFPAARFIGSAAFSGTASEIRYTTAGGQTQLILDANGDGVGDAVLTLSNGVALRQTYPDANQLEVALPQISGSEYSDTLTGGALGEELSGRSGDDTLSGGGGADSLVGGWGNDMLFGEEGNDLLDGGEENDRLDGGSGDDMLYGGAGNDWLISLAGRDMLDGGAGDDSYVVASKESGVYEMVGGGYDTVYTLVDYVLAGGQPIEQLAAYDPLSTSALKLGGNELSNTLIGNAGANELAGNEGQDWLIGGGGDDIGLGGTGHDSIWGGDGGDLLIGGAGDDTIVGGAGIDTVSYADAEAGVEINLSILEEQLTRGAGIDTLVSIENVTGSRHGDVLAGNASANLFRGGAGNDRFVFDATILAARDGILDFSAGDRIDLRAVDREGVDPDFAAFSFLGAAAFSGGARALRVTGSGVSWLVEGDLNGDHVADFSIAVTTTVPGLGLSASDFLL